MSSKKWVLTLISLSLVIVIGFGSMTWLLDPLLQYSKEPGLLTYRHYTEMYSNPGIAKNYTYDAVFLGSSMVENADVSELNALFDCTAIKVPYSGASSCNHKTILDVCYQSGNTINSVFWALDEYALTTDKDTPRYPLPLYLYDYDLSNDLSYLLNLDVFYFYTIKSLFGTATGNTQPLMRDGAWFSDDSAYCKANALASFAYPMEAKSSKGPLLYEKELTDNLTHNILPFLDQHPETTFYFYMVPYSISYWYMSRQKGTLDAELYNIRYAVEKILEYDNAQVFFFQDQQEIITDLDNYKDYTHFHPRINSYMSQQMALGNFQLTKENYNAVLDDFHAYLMTFHYDEFYLENMV